MEQNTRNSTNMSKKVLIIYLLLSPLLSLCELRFEELE